MLSIVNKTPHFNKRIFSDKKKVVCMWLLLMHVSFSFIVEVEGMLIDERDGRICRQILERCVAHSYIHT
jgi:hypothetical protein